MELVNVYSTGRTVDFQRYDDKDNQLIVSSYTNTEMDPNVDVVEVTVYGESGEFLDYNPIITTFKVAQGNVNPVTGFYTKIELDPKADVNALGLTRGRVSAQYNLLKPLFNSSNVSKYWIKEISPSGTELKLSSQNLSNEVIRAGFANFQAYVSTKNYYVDFYLNFGQNRLVIANNAILSEEDGEVYLLVKLYEPLPEDFEVKDTLWICDRIADSVIYTIDTQIVEDPTAVQNALRGPNNRIKVRERVGQTTPYYSYSSLFSSTVSSSLQQLLSYYQDKSIEINVDYSDFSNFIHFSSATERINNFVYKLGLIEQYRAEIEDTTTFSSMSPSSLTIVSQSNVLAQQSIDNIINKFDTYEYYLYFSSESFAWPKSNSTKPYQLYSVTSPQALTWLGSESTVPTATTASILYSASLYDNRNPDRLSNAIPQYLLEDPTNEPYVTFIDMVGQHFDNVWLYYKDLSNRYSSFNSPNLGLSKDMVADALRGFGFNLYTNTSVSDNLYYTLFGMNQDGSLLPPTGSEIITEYVTSSIDTLSPKQLDAEVYKRLYHNLTYLLKTKGTQRGVKALIASYGIPEEILDVNEFGGNNRYAGSGIYEINDQKINYFTQNTELSSSVLSPYVTLQSYNTDNRLNTNDIEVGFSPSDQINRNFVSSSGFVNLDQLIGNPRHQNLSYYPDLKTASDNYFASYNYPHSIWEYIRIIKYYNNSLFKTIKDFVPSKANASTGIIVKSHILERNKYARTEPSMSFDNNISESIDMISIAGSNPGAVQGSTQYADIINTSFGYVTKDYTEDLAKFTGKLSGSFVQATNGEAFEQDDYPDRLLPKRLRDGSAFVWYTDGIMKETQAEAEATAGSTSAFAYTESDTINVSSAVYATPDFSTQYQRTLINLIPLTFATYLGLNDGFGNEYVINIGAPLGGSLVIQIIQTKTASISYNNTNYGAIFQNVFTANRSKRFFELDYGFNQKVPTNFGLVTQSISSSINNNFNTYNDPYAPYADIQDYNYATRAFTDARYYGSKTKSLKYNEYTKPNSTLLDSGSIIGTSYSSPLLSSSAFLQDAGLVGATLTSDLIVTRFAGSRTVDKTYTLSPLNFDSATGTLYVSESIKDVLKNGTTPITYTTPILSVSRNPITVTIDGKLFYKFSALTITLTEDQITTYQVFYSSGPASYLREIYIKAESAQIDILEPVLGSTVPSIRFSGYTARPSFDFKIEYKKYYEGDSSYGLAAAIDRNSMKVGWVKNIPSQSLNFPDKTSVSLKYHVDIDKNLTELNLRNLNLFDTQNLFKTGDTVIVSLTNVSKPSFQKTLDGNQRIYKGGFSYDPIVYREKSEPLTFQDDMIQGVIAQNQGLKRGELNFYTYDVVVNRGIWWTYNQIVRGYDGRYSPDTTGLLGYNTYGYYWDINYSNYLLGSPAQQGGMAVGYLNPNNLHPDLRSSIATNFTRPPWVLPNFPVLSLPGINVQRMFVFSLLKFGDTTIKGAYNSEPTDVTNEGQYLYVAPNQGTYTIEASVPFSMAVSQAGNSNGYVFKVYFTIEKSATPNDPNSWNPILNSQIVSVPKSQDTTYDSQYNCLFFDAPGNDNVDNWAYALAELKIQKAKVALNKGDTLRVNFYLGDIHRAGFWFSKQVRFEIGKPNSQTSRFGTSGFPATSKTFITVNDYAKVPDPYFEIYNEGITVVTYNNLLTVSGSFLFDAVGDALYFTPETTPLFQTSSYKFIPSTKTDTYKFYTPVIDYFSIKTHDLIRIGSFFTLKPDYYEVVRVEEYGWQSNLSQASGLTVTADLLSADSMPIVNQPDQRSIIVLPNTPQVINYLNDVIRFNNRVFNIRGQVDSRNALQYTIATDIPIQTFNNRLWVPVTPNAATTGFTPPIQIEQRGITITLIINSTTTPIQAVPAYKVILDRPVAGSGNLSTAFAILRPKPDETSVILDFTKAEGEVSQTILIPQDASKELKNSVGDLYKNLNQQVTDI